MARMLPSTIRFTQSPAEAALLRILDESLEDDLAVLNHVALARKAARPRTPLERDATP